MDEIEHNRLARNFAGIEANWNTYGTGSTSATTGDVHMCNCVGCCRECGMCRTHPRHTPDVCKKLKALDAERHRIIYDD